MHISLPCGTFVGAGNVIAASVVFLTGTVNEKIRKLKLAFV